MEIKVPGSVMTLLAALAATLQFVTEQEAVALAPVLGLVLKSLAVFITIYLGKTNTGTYHHIPGTRKVKPVEPAKIVKP